MRDYRQIRPIFLNASAMGEASTWRDLGAHVIRMSTNKTQGLTAGSWEVELVPAPDADSRYTIDDVESFIYQSIHPMDAVILGVEAPDDTNVMRENHWMFGIVDGVYKSKSTYGDGVSRSIRVHGRDGTKVFLEDNVANAPELATDERAKRLLGKRVEFMDFIRGLEGKGDAARNIFMQGNIPEALMWILKNAPAMRIRVPYFDRVVEPHELFATSLVSFEEDRLFDETMNQYAGSVLNYMQQLIDPMFYDLWVDTLPADSPLNARRQTRPIVILRPKPYDHAFEIDADGEPVRRDVRAWDPGTQKATHVMDGPTTWASLTSPITGRVEQIPEGHILDKGLGVSDGEVFTMFKQLNSKDPIASSIVGQYGMYYPMIDAGMMQLFGLRELRGQSKMIGMGLDAPGHYITDTEILQAARLGAVAMGITLPMVQPNLSMSMNDVIKRIQSGDMAQMATIANTIPLTKWKRDRLWRWNRYNHILESGRVTVRGRNVFVGSKAVLPDEYSRQAGHKGMEFMVMSVSQQYAMGSPWTTNLSLARGHNTTDLRAYHDFRRWNEPAGENNGILTTDQNRVL